MKRCWNPTEQYWRSANQVNIFPSHVVVVADAKNSWSCQCCLNAEKRPCLAHKSLSGWIETIFRPSATAIGSGLVESYTCRSWSCHCHCHGGPPPPTGWPPLSWVRWSSTALWSHVRVIVVVEDPPSHKADPPLPDDNVMDGWGARPSRWLSVLVRWLLFETVVSSCGGKVQAYMFVEFRIECWKFVQLNLLFRRELGWHAPLVAADSVGGNEGSRSADRWCGPNDESSPVCCFYAVRNGSPTGTRHSWCWWLSAGILVLAFTNLNQVYSVSFSIVPCW